MSDVTRILNAIEGGDPKAADELLPLVYEELRLLAAQKMAKEKPGQTLQATALVHEVFIRLVGGEAETYKNRSHFFVAAAEAMRRILIENARRKNRLKRGGGQLRKDLDEKILVFDGPSDDLLGLDEALKKLAEEEPVVTELVKLRFFGGFTLKQAAVILNIPPRTADRYWAYARGWLYNEIKNPDSSSSGQIPG